MQSLAKSKGALTLAVLIFLAILLYRNFATITSPEMPSAASIGADLIKISEDLSRATLSREVFNAAGYRFLSDFSRALELEPVGRANPFAPIGQ